MFELHSFFVLPELYQDLVRFERLGNIIDCSQVHCLCSGLYSSIPGHHHDHSLSLPADSSFQKSDTVHFRHPYVAKHHIEVSAFKQGQPLLSVFRGSNVVILPLQDH